MSCRRALWLPLALIVGCAPAARAPARLPDAPAAEAPARGPDRRAAPPSAPSRSAREVQAGRASYYSDRLAGRATASGEPYDPSLLTAAHRTLPLGSIVIVTREDGRSVQLRINDRGPFGDSRRIIDVSRRAATELGMIKAGVIDVQVEVLHVPEPKAGRARKRRR